MITKEALLKRVEEEGVVPVLKLKNAADAVPVCAALARGGLRSAEITFRTDAAAESIRRVSQELPEVLVGAGTITSIAQARQAVGAGAQFLVTPGFNPKVVSWCVEQEIPVIPGCPNTSDIEAAMELGITSLKFFPAETMGGIKAINDLCAPYGGIRFMATGGIGADNMSSYLLSPKVLAVGGTWMVKEPVIDAGSFDKIEADARAAVLAMHDFTLLHVGVNSGAPQQALAQAGQLASLFGWSAKEGTGSVMVGGQVELMKIPGRGACGHLGIGVNSVVRAKTFLERQGVRFAEDTVKYLAGRLINIYLQDDVAGFAVHLMQK